MEESKRTPLLRWTLLALCPPAGLTILFFLLRRNRAAMNFWVFRVAAPVEQSLGRFWGQFPFSVAEVLTGLALAWLLLWLGRTVVLAVRQRDGRRTLRRLAALAAALLWLWAGLCWSWNAVYYADPFTQRSGLDVEPYDVDRLAAVTRWFAQRAAALAEEMPRDAEGHVQLPEDCFSRGTAVYAGLEQEFPFLHLDSPAVKPLLCSKLQSALGFTGVYFPFTGEANVNIDAPACLIPATVAHEMAHQRMVASELEANFVGIAACITSEDPMYQYSGYLMGLVQLCNALYPADPQAWKDIAAQTFTQAMATDWTDNNAYWAARRSAAEETASRTYDAFLKSNDPTLGMRSYGACVDLLVTYFGP